VLAGRSYKKDKDGNPLTDADGRIVYTDEAVAEARAWLYDWVRNPRGHVDADGKRHGYSDYSIMPSFRLSPREALDISAYLLTLRRPGAKTVDGHVEPTKDYMPDNFGFDEKGKPKLDDTSNAMLRELVILLLSGKTNRDMAEARLDEKQMVTNPRSQLGYLADLETANDKNSRPLAPTEIGQVFLTQKGVPVFAGKDDRVLIESKWTTGTQLKFLGQKMVQHYGCNGCHKINGFEDSGSACAKLDDWGFKDPHKLDFGYFDHAFDKHRRNPTNVWKTDHEGLRANAPHIKAPIQSDGVRQTLAHTSGENLPLQWEEMDLERRPWLYNKLHNPRVFNRGQSRLDGSSRIEVVGKKLRFNLGSPYDKLKMPKFHLTDDQVKSVVTFVTAVRKPLVDPNLQEVAGPVGPNAIAGQQVLALYNCKGCHNVDGNEPLIYKHVGMLNPDGTLNTANLDWGAPRLIGQGAKTKPQWLVYFLRNVHKMRPTKTDNPAMKLQLRMPSFPIDIDQATRLADYFGSWSKQKSQKLQQWLEPIEAYRKQRLAQVERSEQTVHKLRSRQALTEKDSPEFIRLKQRIDSLVERQSRQTPPAWFDSQSEKVRSASRHLMEFIYDDFALIRAKKIDEDREPLDVDDAADWVKDRATNWEQVRTAGKMLGQLFDVEYPFPPGHMPRISQERFERGLALFKEMQCSKCHSLGDEQKLLAMWKLDNPAGVAAPPAKPDDDAGFFDEPDDTPKAAAAAPLGPAYTAPNLKNVAARLQWKWVDQWLRGSTTILPAAKMPVQFPGGGTAFFQHPPDKKEALHGLYSASGKDQRKLLMDFLYAASDTNYTPFEERLAGLPLPAQNLQPIKLAQRSVAPGFGNLTIKAAETTTQTVTPTGPTVVKTKSDIALHEEPTTQWKDDAGKGRLVGVVKWTGSRPRLPIIGMSKDKFCDSNNSPPRKIETYVVNKDLTVQHVLIHVKDGPVIGKKYKETTPVVMDQIKCMYFPHVQAMVARQPLLVRNSDSTLHNVRTSLGHNISQVEGAVSPVQINKAQLGVVFQCDVHPWMKGQLHVLSHPFFFVSDVEGRFEIKGLEPGKYVFEAYHETANEARGAVKPVTFEVEIKTDTSHRQDVQVMIQK